MIQKSHYSVICETEKQYTAIMYGEDHYIHIRGNKKDRGTFDLALTQKEAEQMAKTILKGIEYIGD